MRVPLSCAKFFACKRVAKRIGCFAIAYVGVSHQLALGQDQRLLGSARTVLIQSDVIFNKNRKFDSAPIPVSYIYQAGLLGAFREVDSNPQIIAKFHKDVFLIDEEKISLTVFDAENNTVIYSEERTLVDERNDVTRLVSHFLAKVRTERAAIADQEFRKRETEATELAAEKAREMKQELTEDDVKALNEATVIVTFYSASDSLAETLLKANRSNPNEFHVYLKYEPRKVHADVVLDESVSKGVYTVTLTSRDGEVLHTEAAPEKFMKRALAAMSKWIVSSPWE